MDRHFNPCDDNNSGGIVHGCFSIFINIIICSNTNITFFTVIHLKSKIDFYSFILKLRLKFRKKRKYSTRVFKVIDLLFFLRLEYNIYIVKDITLISFNKIQICPVGCQQMPICFCAVIHHWQTLRCEACELFTKTDDSIHRELQQLCGLAHLG